MKITLEWVLNTITYCTDIYSFDGINDNNHNHNDCVCVWKIIILNFACKFFVVAVAAVHHVFRCYFYCCFNRFCCRLGRTFVALALTVMDRCSFNEKQTSLICSYAVVVYLAFFYMCQKRECNFQIFKTTKLEWERKLAVRFDSIKICMQILSEYQMSLTIQSIARFSGFEYIFSSFAISFSPGTFDIPIFLFFDVKREWILNSVDSHTHSHIRT